MMLPKQPLLEIINGCHALTKQTESIAIHTHMHVPVNLSLTHCRKNEALCDSIDGQQQNINTIPPQQSGPTPFR